MKLADAVLEYLSARGVEKCFAVTGGAAAHIFDSLSRSPIKTIHMHHEQACAMAADGYARLAGKPALVVVTNGPGVSNAITGVLGAFQDSIPMIVISGQVPTSQMLFNSGGARRQFGVQEVDTEPLVSSIVKHFVCVRNEKHIHQAINESWNKAVTGRPGPVWIEIPLDIQAKEVNAIDFVNIEIDYSDAKYDEVLKVIGSSKKPLIIIGGGVHSSKSASKVVDFATTLGVPVVSTWGANDVFPSSNPYYLGNFGIIGNRVPNIAVQKADALIILGSRMSIPNIGYETNLFSPFSYKVMVDIELEEMLKSSLKVNLPIQHDLNSWLSNFPLQKFSRNSLFHKWHSGLLELLQTFDLDREEFIKDPNSIDSYAVIDSLSSLIESDATLVTDMGTSFTCTMQAFRNKRNTRLFTSSGTSSMGFGLPGAIGAFFADPRKPIYLIAGDGGFQMNLQELQTIQFHKIPLKIIVLNSNGYLAISIMQQNLFQGNVFGSTYESGIDAPNFEEVAKAFGIKARRINQIKKLEIALKELHETKSAVLLDVQIPSKQLMRPRSQSLRKSDGTFYSQGIDLMWPYLEEKELNYIDSVLN